MAAAELVDSVHSLQIEQQVVLESAIRKVKEEGSFLVRLMLLELEAYYPSIADRIGLKRFQVDHSCRTLDTGKEVGVHRTLEVKHQIDQEEELGREEEDHLPSSDTEAFLVLLEEGDIRTDQLQAEGEAWHLSCSNQVLRSCCSKELEEQIDRRNCLFATATIAD